METELKAKVEEFTALAEKYETAFTQAKDDAGFDLLDFVADNLPLIKNALQRYAMAEREAS